MRPPRNPFRLQSSESIESDVDFLRLFGPPVLELLPETAVSGRPLLIQSAPGGGKTTLLRVFTPSVLMTLQRLRKSDPFREIFSKLCQLGIVDENGIRTLGIMLSCRRTFPTLADLDLPAPRHYRLLRALLDSRIVLGALRGLLQAHSLRYPDGLSKVQVVDESLDEQIPGLSLPTSGVGLRDWAERVERKVCTAIDSLNPADSAVQISGHDELHSLRLLDGNGIGVENKYSPSKWLVLLDDMHRLTSGQRTMLLETLLEQRSATSVWIAERLEALSSNDILASGVLENRDYQEVISLESRWQKRKHFEMFVTAIADRRTRMAADTTEGTVVIDSFNSSLQGELSTPQEEDSVYSALQVVTNRVAKLAGKRSRYSGWIESRQQRGGTPYDRLVAMRSLEILIERDIRKSQYTLDFELSTELLEKRDESGVRTAAELFLANEFDFPYYFGSSCLAKLGFFNVEQYLRLAGDLFEESLAGALLRKEPTLSARRQEQILVATYEKRVSDLPLRAHHGRDVLNFLDATGQFCREITNQPNAPYAPGVTGIAISMDDRDELVNPRYTQIEPSYRRFKEMLATALAQNIFRAHLDRKVKHGRYMVLYLNRFACVYYRLPLQYGGFREKPLSEFISWLENGYVSSNQLRFPWR